MKLKMFALLFCLPIITAVFADEEQDNICPPQEDTVAVNSQDFRDDEEIDYTLLQNGSADLAVGAKKGVAHSFYLGMSPKFAELPIQTQRNLIASVTKETHDGVYYFVYEDGQLTKVDSSK